MGLHTTDCFGSPQPRYPVDVAGRVDIHGYRAQALQYIQDQLSDPLSIGFQRIPLSEKGGRTNHTAQ